jgi:hypothetical protein
VSESQPSSERVVSTATKRSPKTVEAQAPSIPAGSETSRRPWDSPHARDFGIPWTERRYLFDWTDGRCRVADVGDGLASHGGYSVQFDFNRQTGEQKFKSATLTSPDKDIEALFDKQNRNGFPYLTYHQVDKIYALSEKNVITIRDAFFEITNLSEVTEDQQLECAKARDVYAISRTEAKADTARENEARKRLEEIRKRRGV